MEKDLNDIIMLPTDYRMILTKELAENGNMDAMIVVYRDIYARLRAGNYLVEDEKILMLKYLRVLAENGNSDATLDLGTLYYLGLGVEQSYSQAVDLYKKSSQELDSVALCNLGYCYYYGRDMEVDYEKAYECFSNSAFLNYYNAMYKLGDMYLNGYHVRKDDDAALYWFNEANEYCDDYEGQPSVDYRLGLCYLYGYGADIDILMSLRFLYRAELAFAEHISEGISFAELTLPKVKVEIDKARARLYTELNMLG